MSIKATGMELEMLTAKSIERALKRLPADRALPVLDFVRAHVATWAVAADYPQATIPTSGYLQELTNSPAHQANQGQLGLSNALTGTQRQG